MPRARMRLRSISPAEVICQFAFSENEIAVEVFPLAACHFDRMEVKDIFWQISCQNRRENGDNRGVSEGIRSERKCLRINDFHPLLPCFTPLRLVPKLDVAGSTRSPAP